MSERERERESSPYSPSPFIKILRLLFYLRSAHIVLWKTVYQTLKSDWQRTKGKFGGGRWTDADGQPGLGTAAMLGGQLPVVMACDTWRERRWELWPRCSSPPPLTSSAPSYPLWRPSQRPATGPEPQHTVAAPMGPWSGIQQRVVYCHWARSPVMNMLLTSVVLVNLRLLPSWW